MKFKCTCGHTVVDIGQSDHIKGEVLRAQSFDAAYAQPSATIAEFIRAVCEGKRKDWIESFYGRAYFEIPDSEVVFDIIAQARHRTSLEIYQCEACGRLFIEREPRESSSPLRCFKPEDTDWKGTLSDETAA